MGDNSLTPIDAVLLADGLTNQQGMSGEYWINQAAETLGWETSWTRYEPHSFDGRVVETTTVFPHFFGLTPERNPGRAGLERFLDGDLHDQCGNFAVLQGRGLARRVRHLALDSSVHIRPSSYSPSANSWLICSADRKLRDEFLKEVRRITPSARIAHVVSPAEGWLTSTQEAVLSGRRHFLVGWCHGALLAAFQLCGVSMSADIQFESDPAETRDRRMLELGGQLDRSASAGLRPIVYLKDPAWAARRSHSKEVTFKHIVKALKRMLDHSGCESILVISDHNSEPGVDETLTGETVVGVVTKRSEVATRWNDQFRFKLTQLELVEELGLAWL